VPNALPDLLAMTALTVMLVVAFVHPPARLEALVSLVAAAAVVVLGLAPRASVVAELGQLAPVVAFLMAILLVAEVCAAEGVFVWVGRVLSRTGDGRPARLLGLTFLAASLTTAVLSLDATVVLLTPVVAAAAVGAVTTPRPSVYACVRLANSASLLLPVSNLTNLLAMPSLRLSLVPFALAMTPVWLTVIAVEFAGHRLFFRRDMQPSTSSVPEREDLPLPRFAISVVAVMLLGFAVTSPLGVAPAWVAAVAALVLTARALRQGTFTTARAVRALHPSFAVYVLSLGVVVVSVAHTFLGRVVADALPEGSSLGALLLVMLTATVLANVVNNLPATLLLVPLAAPLGPASILAALIGLNVGSNLTYSGSLANLLWRRTLVRHGMRPSAVTFHRLSALVTLPAALAGVVVLWLWVPLLG
jgi:arsenical pump membrane protein